jgi:hypothetical protein
VTAEEWKAYRAFVWWLIKTCGGVVSVALNGYFFWLLSQL